jgi:hypothetical protein
MLATPKVRDNHAVLKRVLLLSLLASFALAESSNREAINRAKQVQVYAFDPSLPKTSLESFLRQASGDAPTTWEVNDCGEQTGDPETESERDVPVCVQATVTVADGPIGSVTVAVGTARKGVSGAQELYEVTVTHEDVTDTIQLRDLPGRLRPSEDNQR